MKMQDAKIDDLRQKNIHIDTLYQNEKKVAERAENRLRIANQSYYLTPEERDLIERVVSSEARGESMKEIMAVSQTIRDRSELWGKSIPEVVKDQYAPPYQGEVPDIVMIGVSNVFDKGERIFTDPVTHFHNDTVTPYWASTKINRGRIGNTRFYY